MKKNLYVTPVIWASSDDMNPTVIGEGSGQGSIPPENMSFEDWWDEIAWGGTNPDADYDGNGTVDEADYKYYIDNHLWDEDAQP